MTRPTSMQSSRQHLFVATLIWLAAGSALLALPLVPAWSTTAGWSGAFWLGIAPAIMTLALQPALPRQLLALATRRRRPARRVAWH